MSFLIGLVIFAVGAMFGVIIFSCLVAGGRADDAAGRD